MLRKGSKEQALKRDGMRKGDGEEKETQGVRDC